MADTFIKAGSYKVTHTHPHTQIQVMADTFIKAGSYKVTHTHR